ncbi:MAG: restriction endonuclease [Methanomassiliicoccales archaeon]
MPKFCSNCGHPFSDLNAKFCVECGQPTNAPSQQPVPVKVEIQQNTEPSIQESDDEVVLNPLSKKELGNRFESVVQQILEFEGYTTERNVRIKDAQGHNWEIDILARKNRNGVPVQLAVECKNYKSTVGRDKIIYFRDGLSNTGIRNGLFVAYSQMSRDAREMAEASGIQVWESDDVQQRFFSLSCGRGVQTRDEFINAIPLKISFDQAKKINLNNSQFVQLEKSELIWKPYYRIEYRFRNKFYLPNRQVKNLEDSGFCVVNGIDSDESFLQSSDGKIKSGGKTDGLKKITNMITGSIDEDQVISNELSTGAVKEYRVEREDGYQIRKIEPSVSKKEARRRAMDLIIEFNTEEFNYHTNSGESRSVKFIPYARDIYLYDIHPIFIPIWQIEFSSLGRTYSRIMYGNSGTILTDTIAVCPNHILKNIIKVAKKNTIAICEVCGDALCEQHVFKCPACGKWLCEEHSRLCPECKDHFCPEHFQINCQMCNTQLCVNCISQCQICGRYVCNEHARECDRCGKNVCVNCCSTTGSFFKKTDLCRICSPK